MRRTVLVLLAILVLAVSTGCARQSSAAPGPRTFNAKTVTVTGTVTAVNVKAPSTASQRSGNNGSGNARAMQMDLIDVRETGGTTVTVNLGRNAKEVSVKVGDTITVTGFETSRGTTMLMARTFKGADGKTVTLASGNMRGRPGNGAAPSNPSASNPGTGN